MALSAFVIDSESIFESNNQFGIKEPYFGIKQPDFGIQQPDFGIQQPGPPGLLFSVRCGRVGAATYPFVRESVRCRILPVN